jgi:CotH protein/type IX secretion system substrate protein/lamin tail-like protein
MKIIQCLTIYSLCLLPALAPAQTPFPELPPVFKDDAIPRVDVMLPPDSLAILLAPGNEQSNYHWHATFIFDNGELKDTVENVGFRLRGNTSRLSAKKSFKISFNTYVPGRKWQGLEKLNLNGEHNDPSVVRSKICWDMLRWLGVPAPRSNHADLYINGEYRGLYINVEHVDEEFVQNRFGNNDGNLYKCLWPADLDYKGADPNLYKEEFSGRRAYQLLTNTAEDDYADLAHFIGVLNNTPIAELPCELEQVFNVDTYLKAIVSDVLSANWDGPIFNKNNFYLYKNEATGLFEYIPYDLDNTFGIDWFSEDWANRDIYNWAQPGEPRPIYTRLMQVPEYRDRYSYYMQQFLNGYFHAGVLFPYLEAIKTMISPAAQADPFRPLDYGFTFVDFQNSYNEALPVFHTPIGLKPFVTTRRSSALQQLVVNDIAPVITQVTNNYPNALQDVLVTARAGDDGGLAGVEVCYKWSGQSLACVPMFDDGQHADGTAGDGLFGTIIPALNEASTLQYFVQATDNGGLQSRQPRCIFRELPVGLSTVPLVINEFMASNQSTLADEAGEYDDWLEIFSMSDVPVYLGNYFLSDRENTPGKWPFPDIWIQPQEYLIVWADKDEVQGPLHTNFKLSAGGEFTGIFDSAANGFARIDGIAFGPQATDAASGRLPNGTGPFQPVTPTPGAHNEPLTTDVFENENGIEAVVYPNPFSGEVSISFSKKGVALAEVLLSDALGNVVAKGKGKTIPTAGLPAGMYFLIVKTEGGNLLTRKVVKGR